MILLLLVFIVIVIVVVVVGGVMDSGVDLYRYIRGSIYGRVNILFFSVPRT